MVPWTTRKSLFSLRRSIFQFTSNYPALSDSRAHVHPRRRASASISHCSLPCFMSPGSCCTKHLSEQFRIVILGREGEKASQPAPRLLLENVVQETNFHKRNAEREMQATMWCYAECQLTFPAQNTPDDRFVRTIRFACSLQEALLDMRKCPTTTSVIV